MGLKNKVAVVTGGGGGLGYAIAANLHAQGMRVVLADLDGDVAERAAERLGSEGGAALARACDVTNPSAVDALFEFTSEALGAPHALINSAGIGPLRSLFDITPELWNQVIAVNLTGTFLCCQAAARYMIEQRAGRIINIASVSGVRAGFARSAYGTSKAAVLHLTRQLAVELGPFGVNVNAVGPGPVDTELALANHTPEMRADYHAMIPLARYGTPKEMADAVTFLCSEAASYVNGQALFVDGGFLAGGVAVRTAQAAAGQGTPADAPAHRPATAMEARR